VNDEIKTEPTQRSSSNSEEKTDDEAQIFSVPLFPNDSFSGDEGSYYNGSDLLPSVSPYQRQDFYEKGGSIFNIASMGAYTKDFVKLYEVIGYYSRLEEEQDKQELEKLEFEQAEPNDKVTRILYGLQQITEKYRQNIMEIIDPPILNSRKERRLQKKKEFRFINGGYREMITMMEKHMTALVEFGKYPQVIFKNFKECAEKAMTAIEDKEAMRFGMDVLLCAEAVLPLEETIIPEKRISEGIASPSQQQ